MVRPEYFQPETVAHMVHPFGLIGIIAGSKIDKVDPVDIKHMLKKCSRQQCAGRGLHVPFVMRQLVDHRGTVLDRPELRRHRLPINIGKTQSQRARRSLALCKLAQKFRTALAWFPTAGVDTLIITPAFAAIFVLDTDCYSAGLTLALDRVFQSRRAAFPLGVEAAPGHLQDMISVTF